MSVEEPPEVWSTVDIAMKILAEAEARNAIVCLIERNADGSGYPNRLSYCDYPPDDSRYFDWIVMAVADGDSLLAIQEDQKKDRSWFRYWFITQYGEFIEGDRSRSQNA